MYNKQTERGTISVSNRVFSDMVLAVLETEGLSDRIWISNRKGKILTNDNDKAASLRVDRTEDGRVDLAFSVVVRFGDSISGLTGQLADGLADLVYKWTGKHPARIAILVAGVRSRNIGRRSIEVVKEYEPQ